MNHAKEKGTEFQRVLVLYGLERLLYRLSVSPYADRFILKGASLFSLWFDEPHRRTRDMDLLGKDEPDPARFAALFQDLCDLSVEDDGLRFLPESVQAGRIREENEFGGVRVTLTAALETARIALQVDIGFGDAAVPEPETVEFPTLLEGLLAPRLLAYQKETTIAEKLHALVVLERGNSRMKDFFDLYVLAREFPFAAERLAAAVRDAFARRGTALPRETPDGLTQEFAADAAKVTQWKAFLKQNVAPPRDTLTLSEAVATLSTFLLPVLEMARGDAAATGKQQRWPAGGPWQRTDADDADKAEVQADREQSAMRDTTDDA
jgi:hypothetical protein